METFGIIVASIVSLLVLGVVGRFISIAMLPVHVIDNTIQTGHDIVDKTINADNALYNYEWFKQQVQDIKAQKNKIDIAQNSLTSFEASAGVRKDWTFEDKTEDARLRSIVQGNQSQLETMVADYNARASEANRNIFQDGLIPSALTIGAGWLK
ncbi:MAG: hypothetical protein NVSMB66_6420 [Candidatus Doudnabacteria bacterium]